MPSKMTKAIRGRVGPVGLSLAAAALTAVAFAAVSVAKDDSGGAVGPPMIENLSDQDKQALEEFRQCMSDQGIEPPAPPKAGEDGKFEQRPEPPSEAQREKMEQAQEACKDKLPEGAQAMGPGAPCGPPPGAKGEGAAIPLPPPSSGSREDQGFATPAPQGSTS